MHKTLLYLCLTCLCWSVCSVAYGQKPNIIFILTDDMGYADLSGYGRKEYQTPNLDKLASQGMKFLNAYAGAAVCTPTRVSYMTGLYPGRVPIGLFEPLVPQKRDSAYGLTTEFPSIATRMVKAGYETALIGKWHLGFLPQHYPLRNGFQYFFGMLSGATDYIGHTSDGGAHDLHEMDSLVHPEGYLTDILSDKAIQYIRRDHSKPFFLTVTFNAPHWPWQRRGDLPYPDSLNFRAGGSPEIYASMMSTLDEAVGKIMQSLDETGLAENTIVIFTNDNGGERYSDNGGYSAKKLTLWEGGIRVPAFVRWPGKIQPGTTSQVAITMDWTATILAAGGTNISQLKLDGIDLLPVLTGKKTEIERMLYWRLAQRAHSKAVRRGNWKYLQDEKGEYLFNLAEDQFEKKDLKMNYPEMFYTLKKKHRQWESRLLTPLPLVTTH
jgi:arylsulfatase A-like enzyme